MINDLVREVQTGFVHATNRRGQPICGGFTRGQTISSSQIGDDSETNCPACRQNLHLPSRITTRC